MVHIDLYVFCINLSNELIGAIAGMSDSPGKLGAIATMVLGSFETPGANVVVSIVFVILIGYAVIKVFFANLKRGGILLVMMATGSLYLFSVPRGYSDGFVSWANRWQLSAGQRFYRPLYWLQGWLLITQICCLASD